MFLINQSLVTLFYVVWVILFGINASLFGFLLTYLFGLAQLPNSPPVFGKTGGTIYVHRKPMAHLLRVGTLFPLVSPTCPGKLYLYSLCSCLNTH